MCGLLDVLAERGLVSVGERDNHELDPLVIDAYNRNGGGGAIGVCATCGGAAIAGGSARCGTPWVGGALNTGLNGFQRGFARHGINSGINRM